MRRSLGGGHGGLGGGSGRPGGGGMLKSVQRAVGVGGGAASQESFPHSSSSTTTTTTTTTSPKSPTKYKPTSPNTLLLSSSNSTNPSSPFSRNPLNLPISAATSNSTWGFSCSSPTYSTDDDFDQWECIDEISHDNNYNDDELAAIPIGFNSDDHFVFGSVPSVDEVQHAVSSIKQVLNPVSSQLIKEKAACDSDRDVADHTDGPTGLIGRVPSVGLDVDWMEPSLQLQNSSLLKLHSCNKVYDAVHLLQTEPCVQRMVISLSSDKAVWDAVLNNEVVRELRESLDDAYKDDTLNSDSDEGSDDSAATNILSWIFDNTKAKIMNFIEKITKMVDELFLPPESEKKTEKAADSFEEKLRSSFLLSVVVFLVVVMSRASRA